MATITVADLAIALSTDARTTRRFLRSITPKDSQPGKGSRWAIEKREVRGMTKKFAAFTAAENEKRAARAENDAKNAPAAPENAIENDENENADDFDSLEHPADA